MHTCHSPRPDSSPEFHAVSCQMSVIKILQLCINTLFSVSGRLEHRRVVCGWSVVLPWMVMCADWSPHRRDLERQRNVLDVENWSKICFCRDHFIKSNTKAQLRRGSNLGLPIAGRTLWPLSYAFVLFRLIQLSDHIFVGKEKEKVWFDGLVECQPNYNYRPLT